MTAYYLLLNGPPKSGKSTLAREALRQYTTRQVEAKSESFAAPMKQFISVLLGQPYSSISKDDYHPLLHQTPREFLIDLSESYVKAYYGEDFYGRAAIERTNDTKRPTVFVLDDSGFDSEFDVLPRTRVCLVRIIRPGFDFTSDSRSYLSKPDRMIFNDADLTKAFSMMRDIVDYSVIKWKLWQQNFNLKFGERRSEAKR